MYKVLHLEDAPRFWGLKRVNKSASYTWANTVIIEDEPRLKIKNEMFKKNLTPRNHVTKKNSNTYTEKKSRKNTKNGLVNLLKKSKYLLISLPDNVIKGKKIRTNDQIRIRRITQFYTNDFRTKLEE